MVWLGSESFGHSIAEVGDSYEQQPPQIRTAISTCRRLQLNRNRKLTASALEEPSGLSELELVFPKGHSSSGLSGEITRAPKEATSQAHPEAPYLESN